MRFPVSLGIGLLASSITLPYLGTPIQNLFNEGIEATRRLARMGAARTPPTPPENRPDSTPNR